VKYRYGEIPTQQDYLRCQFSAEIRADVDFAAELSTLPIPLNTKINFTSFERYHTPNVYYMEENLYF
jgi:hypothetical protein